MRNFILTKFVLCSEILYSFYRCFATNMSMCSFYPEVRTKHVCTNETPLYTQAPVAARYMQSFHIIERYWSSLSKIGRSLEFQAYLTVLPPFSIVLLTTLQKLYRLFSCFILLMLIQNAVGISTHQFEESMRTLNQERQQRVHVNVFTSGNHSMFDIKFVIIVGSLQLHW